MQHIVNFNCPLRLEKKKSRRIISDKLQTAFKKALVPEVNCYFCHLPLFSFYQIKGVILRLVLKSGLRRL